MIIELFSGIGRFKTDEDVVYISNDIKTNPTILADVRYLPLKKNIQPTILHGSPPCRYISKMRYRHGYNFEGLAQTFELYAAFWRAVDWLRPKMITFESPENIEKFLGKKIKIKHPKYDIKTATTLLFISSSRQMLRACCHKKTREAILEIQARHWYSKGLH